MSGSVTVRTVRHGPAPRFCAASSTEGSICASDAAALRNTSGTNRMKYASGRIHSDPMNTWPRLNGVGAANAVTMLMPTTTRPDVIVTMNPSATEGNHGNHQQAAMFAVEAYFAAGDPNRFPEHAAEGFEPWQPRRILRAGATGSGASGPGGVAAGYTPRVASDVVFGCWNGTYSEKNG